MSRSDAGSSSSVSAASKLTVNCVTTVRNKYVSVISTPLLWTNSPINKPNAGSSAGKMVEVEVI